MVLVSQVQIQLNLIWCQNDIAISCVSDIQRKGFWAQFYWKLDKNDLIFLNLLESLKKTYFGRGLNLNTNKKSNSQFLRDTHRVYKSPRGLFKSVLSISVRPSKDTSECPSNFQMTPKNSWKFPKGWRFTTGSQEISLAFLGALMWLMKD